MELKDVIFVILIFPPAWEDIRRKRIRLPWIGVLCIYVMICIMQSEESYRQIWIGALPGIVFCTLSMMWKQVMGLGDGIIILLAGIYLGFRLICISLCIAFFLAAVVTAFLLLIRKLGKNEQICFVPFLLLGFLLGMR